MNLAVDATVSAAVEGRLHSLGITIPVFVALFATRSSSGVPQIVQMARSKTPKQVASKWGARVFYGDSLVYLSRIIYHLRRGFPVSCWSELIPLMVQNLACFILLRKTLSDGPDKRRRQLLTVGFDAAFLVAMGAAMFTLPARLLPLLCLWSVPLSVSSYGVQVVETVRMGSSPSAKRASAVTLRWFGCLIRVSTTARLLQGDLPAMASHAIGLVGCSLLLMQRYVIESKGPTKIQTRMALYSQLLGEDSTKWKAVGGRQLPRAIDDTLHAWRSLGGESPPEASKCRSRAIARMPAHAPRVLHTQHSSPVPPPNRLWRGDPAVS